MRCFHLPLGGIGCGPDAPTQSVIVNGKSVYFDFDRRFGPLVTNKRGEPLARQPGQGNAFWGPFNRWLADWLAKNPEPPPPPDPHDKWDSRPTEGREQ
jgi:hypothetical protein